jgi:hypothetical protein
MKPEGTRFSMIFHALVIFLLAANLIADFRQQMLLSKIESTLNYGKVSVRVSNSVTEPVPIGPSYETNGFTMSKRPIGAMEISIPVHVQ